MLEVEGTASLDQATAVDKLELGREGRAWDKFCPNESLVQNTRRAFIGIRRCFVR
jgi:hypothetical protein